MTPEEANLLHLGCAMARAMKKLPPQDQGIVLGLVYKAMLWRGWDEGGGIMPAGSRAAEAVRQIADVLLRNGIEVEQYT
jgi:hypothetical protein